LIVKPLNTGQLDRPDNEPRRTHDLIMTTPVLRADLQSAPDDAIAACPHFFQKEIRKQYELRVVIIGAALHAFKIPSQKLKISSTDWRYGTTHLKFSPFALCDSLQKKIMRTMRRLGLSMGSMDIIIDEDDEAWFLEVNQDGQWAWLDDIVEGEITKSFAHQLDLMSRSVFQHGHFESDIYNDARVGKHMAG